MTWYRVGPAGIPGSLKTDMDAVLNKKFGTSTTYAPNTWPDNVNLLGMLEEKTESGAIAHIEDGADDVPIADGEFNIDYTGTAVSELTIRQTGKNLLDDTKRYTTPGNAVVSMNNTGWNDKAVTLPAGDYFISAITNQGANAVAISIGNAGNASPIKTIGGNSGSFSLSQTADIWIKITIYPGSTSDLIGVMLTPGTTAQNYESFISISDKIVDFDGHVLYGGSYNSTTGVLTSTKAADGSDLSDPVEYQIDPTIINSLLGANNIYSDVGNTAIVYRSSGTETPVPVVPTLITKTITENGTYSAEDDDADGYSEVTVNVQGGVTPFVPQFTETLIADNTAHGSSFTLSEDYGNYDMVKIVWYESATVSGFLYTTPDILDEIFTVGVGKLCVNKPSTNYYICYTKNGLTWTQTNQRNIFIHEIYGVTFTNCTMQATDLYKRGASTTTKYTITSLTSLKDYDLFIMSSIHATDGSETMPTTWLYQYPPENMSGAFSCPVPAVLQEYNANDEAFIISEYEMSAARYFMVQGITFTPTN